MGDDKLIEHGIGIVDGRASCGQAGCAVDLHDWEADFVAFGGGDECGHPSLQERIHGKSTSFIASYSIVLGLMLGRGVKHHRMPT